MVSLLAALPSSSAQDPRTTLNAILIDVIWTVDVGLDDSLPSVSSKTELPADVKATYDNDRRLLASLVKALVVRQTYKKPQVFKLKHSLSLGPRRPSRFSVSPKS